jgi:AraC family transcriptional regulator
MNILKPGQYNGYIQNSFHEDGLLVSISAYEEAAFSDAWHCHENAHLSFVLKGGRWEQKKGTYECAPGKTTYYNPGEPHRMIRMQDSTHINLELGPPFLEKYQLTEQALENIFRKTPDTVLLMVNIYKELAAGHCSDASIPMLLLGFITQAERRRFDHQMPAWIHTVRDYLHANWMGKISLTELSEAVGVHPVTISHYFPKYFSSTLGTYMRKLKVEKALPMLNAPDISLTSACYECGFFDQSHFTRVFKEYTGFLPSQYLRLLK